MEIYIILLVNYWEDFLSGAALWLFYTAYN